MLYVLGIVSMFALFALWVIILITGKRSKGLYDFLVGINYWSTRVMVYTSHMTDKYPPFSLQQLPEYGVRINCEYVEEANRLTAFFRWILVIPHWFIVWILSYVFSLVAFIHIIIVLFTGKPNQEMFNFLAGVIRWTTRETFYSELLTDDYPPFSLE